MKLGFSRTSTFITGGPFANAVTHSTAPVRFQATASSWGTEVQSAGCRPACPVFKLFPPAKGLGALRTFI